MNFGLDIDGVLTDIESYQLNKGIPFFKKVYNKEIVNEYGKNIQQIFDCTKEEEHKFWAKYLFRYVIDWFSPFARFDAFVYGYFDIGALIYYLSVTGIFLFLSERVFQARRLS